MFFKIPNMTQVLHVDFHCYLCQFKNHFILFYSNLILK